MKIHKQLSPNLLVRSSETLPSSGVCFLIDFYGEACYADYFFPAILRGKAIVNVLIEGTVRELFLAELEKHTHEMHALFVEHITEESAQSLGRDIRRAAVLANLFDQCLEYLNKNPDTAGTIARAAIEAREKIGRFTRALQRTSPAAWAACEEELQGDRVQDLLLLLEEMFTVKNVEDVIQSIRSSKTPLPADA